MVDVRRGNLFDSKAEVLVNTVNCVGVMGKGIALQFKKRFPDMYEDYVRRCARKEVVLGRPYLYRSLLPPAVLNFPTKDHWRSVARLADIVAGLEYFERRYRVWGIRSLAVPPLGCGEGGLDWRIVGPTLYRHLARIEIPVELYAPHGTPDEQMSADFLVQSEADRSVLTSTPYSPKIPPGWVALAMILSRIEAEPYHWPVGRTMLQKLAYFATQAGIPTGLHFERGSYGPFAEDLKGLLSRLINNGLITEKRQGRMLVVHPGPTFPDARRRYMHELLELDPVMERVTDLFVRMNTRQAEVAASVHFTATSLRRPGAAPPTEQDVLEGVQRWKAKRQPALTQEELAEAIRSLNLLGWLEVRPSRDLPLPDAAALHA